MQLLNDNIIVKFDENHNKNFEIAGIELVRPETWEFDQLANGDTQYQKQLDLRQTNPQIAEVIVENKRYEQLKKGDKVFTHFLAFDNSETIENGGEEYKTIMIGAVFFKILENGELEMMEDNYLGEQLIIEEEKTASGIILTPFGDQKEESKIKITHVPKNSPYVKVGDIIYTVDDNQYELDFLGKKYVKLNTWHIVAKA